MANNEVFNPLGNGGKGDFNLVGGESTFITTGTGGISKIRWQSTPSGTLYDMTISDAGAVVITAASGGSTNLIPIWFTLIPQ